VSQKLAAHNMEDYHQGVNGAAVDKGMFTA